ncbi:hypothetical protein V2J09_002496 [Rumex salicifolius]
MEVFSLVLFKLVEWLILTLFANCFYKLAMNIRGYYYSSSLLSLPHKPSFSTPLTTLNKTHVNNFKSSANTTKNTIVCDINGGLLKTSSFFPFFMLFAFEAGSILRAFLLLLSYPFCCLICSHGFKLKVMVFITFFGMRVEAVENVARTVLPKFYLEEINPLVYEMWGLARGKVVISSVPRVMVDWFCREYLGASKVLATELHTINLCNNGLFFSGLLIKSPYEKDKKAKELFGDAKLDVGIFGIQSCVHDNLLLSLCKEAYVVSKDSGNQNFPRKKYPKPLIFHDGRLAFLPTPAAAFTAFLYLPFAVPLSLLRLLVGNLLPFPVATLLNSFSGMRLLYTTAAAATATYRSHHHVLYVSNHRTLVDPIFLSFALRKPLTAVTYSLSRLSELLSPIPTVRLTRNRAHDAAAMKKLLSKGDLVVCPEGTTCREPYLLRFSSLFAELTDEIVPVAVEADVSMFYGTTASGLKWLDPVLFLMNPRPGYSVKVLAKVPPEMTCGGGGRSGVEVANYVQKEVAATLGFECTEFTRKDKYLMLAGTDGFVAADAAAVAAS